VRALSQFIKAWVTASTIVSPRTKRAKDGGGCPYTTSKGVHFATPWKLVFYRYSVQGRKIAHILGCFEQKQQRYVSSILFETSICPSVFGWYVVLMLSVVPCNLNNFFKNIFRNVESLSLTMEVGMPCSLTTSLTNTYATDLVEYICLRGMKWPYLLRRSTTTKTASFMLDLGSLLMKSMLISFQISVGLGKGWSSPCGEHVWYLFYWHTTHARTYSVMVFFMPIQCKDWAILL